MKNNAKWLLVLITFLNIFIPMNINSDYHFDNVPKEEVGTIETITKEEEQIIEETVVEEIVETPTPTTRPSSTAKPQTKPQQQTQTTTNTKSEKDIYLEKMIKLPTTGYNQQEANNMIGRIKLFDTKLLKVLSSKNARLIMTNGPITQTAELSHLKGVVPKGYTSGKTWDDVPGAAGTNPNNIYAVYRIGYSYKGHGSINLELHETSHLIDYFVFGKTSHTEEFIRIKNAERYNIFPTNEYYNYPEEYFAETFAYYFYGSSSRNKLCSLAPQTCAYYAALLGSI